MVLIGLLLILIAIAAGAWLVIGTQSLTTPIDLDTPGLHVSATPLALLIAGAAVLFVLWLGLAAIRGSVKRRRRPAREAREAQRQAEFEENIRADERARAEETHQGAMAERDRVREEEFSAKLAERDRIRDADERTRLAEHEQRVRADERARVEDEHSRRNAEASRVAAASAAGGAGAGAGVAGRHELTNDHGDADARELHEPGLPERDSGAAGDSDTAGDTGTLGTGTLGTAGQTEDQTESDADMARHHPSLADDKTDAEVNEAVDEAVDDEGGDGSEGDRFETVADKLMGRGPTGHG